jgi:hypothetical protein
MSTTSRLADRQEIAEGTMAFRFEKPSGWTFEAGQGNRYHSPRAI